jgi:hypothetical protein
VELAALGAAGFALPPLAALGQQGKARPAARLVAGLKMSAAAAAAELGRLDPMARLPLAVVAAMGWHMISQAAVYITLEEAVEEPTQAPQVMEAWAAAVRVALLVGRMAWLVALLLGGAAAVAGRDALAAMAAPAS